MLAALLLAAAWWGLTQGRPDEPARPPLLLHENLVGLLADGEYVRTTSRIAPASPRGQRHTADAQPALRARAVGTLSETRDGRTETWLVGLRPSFFVDVVHPVDRRLELRLANAAGEAQSVALLFNGRLLTRAALPAGAQALSVAAGVPAALQHVGRNAVELVFDATRPRPVQGQPLPLPVAARWGLADFARPAVHAGVNAAEDAGEDAVPPKPTTILDDGSRIVRLGPASLVRTALVLPDSPRVVLRYSLLRADLDDDLGVTADDGRRLELRSPARAAGLAGSPADTPVEIEHDLTPWAGQAVILDVRTGEAAGGELHIGRAAILHEGPAAPAGAPAPPVTVPTEVVRPSLLLVTFDALARGHVSGLGHDRWTTPNLDRLLEQGVVFDGALAPASTTAASLASLHGGNDPFSHGVGAPGTALSGDTATLAARLAAAGWRTAAFVAHPDAGAARGLDTGFEQFVERRSADGRGAPGAELLPPLQEFLEGVGTQPFFAWVHLAEPAAPYAAPAELQRALVRPYAGTVRGDLDWLEGWPSRDEHVEWEGWTHLRDLYDARVAEGDALLGRVLQSLEWTGHDAHTLVAVTSAHGEALGEHGHVLHGGSVHAEQVDVPLVLAGPGLGHARLPGPASLTDLLPTLLARLGVPAPVGAAPTAGVDLLAGGFDPRRGLPLLGGGPAPMLGWRRGELCLLLDTATRRRELFDMVLDPGQKQDLWAQRPASALCLERELVEAWCRGQAAASAAGEPGPADCGRLRAAWHRL